MNLNSLVDLQILVEASAPTRASFGTPLLLAYHTQWPELTRSYTDLDGVADDGFSASDPQTKHVYAMAQKVLSQNPHVTAFKIGRRQNAFTQTLKLTPINVIAGYEYNLLIDDGEVVYTVLSGDGVDDITAALETAINALQTAGAVTCANKQTYDLADAMTLIYEVDGVEHTTTFATGDFVNIDAATAAEVADAINDDGFCTPSVVGTKVKLESLTAGVESTIQVTGGTANAVLGFDTDLHQGSGVFTAVDGTTHVTLTAVEGYLGDVDLQGTLASDLVSENLTADPGLSDDLDDILDVDAAWYGLALDSNSDAEIHAAAAWIETQTKIFACSSCDSDCVDPTDSEDIGSELMALAYDRTLPMHSRDKLLDYRACAILSLALSQDAGRITWAFKTLAGIAVDSYTATELAAVVAKNFTTYTVTGGRNITYEGKTPADEFIDITHFVDWLHAEIQQDAFDTLAANEKLPYTDEGVAIMVSAIEGALRKGIQRGGLRKDIAPKVTAPRVADVAVADRAARRLPDIAFTAELAGAIHRLVIRGKVVV